MAYRRKATSRSTRRASAYSPRKRVGGRRSGSASRFRAVGRSGRSAAPRQQVIKLVIQQPSALQTPALALGPAPAPRKSTL